MRFLWWLGLAQNTVFRFKITVIYKQSKRIHIHKSRETHFAVLLEVALFFKLCRCHTVSENPFFRAGSVVKNIGRNIKYMDKIQNCIFVV